MTSPIGPQLLQPDRTASLKWSGDFTLPRFRAKLANKYLLHPGLAPGYEEVYRSDLGERTISRKELSSSLSDLSLSMRSGAASPLGGTMVTQLADSRGSALTRLGMSASGASLASAGSASVSGLARSSSVPTVGLRRLEAQPAAARLGITVNAEKERAKERMPSSPMSPDDKKEREKEMATEAASRRLWAAAHGSEIHIMECLELRKDDPSISLKTWPVPGMQKALKQGAKIDWRNDEWDGGTLLIKAVRSDSEGLAEYVLSQGGDLLAVDKSGRGVFHWAAMQGNPSMLTLFLNNVSAEQRPTAVNAPDNGGDTPLHLAAYYGHLPIIRLLIRMDVDPMQPNAMGYSAIDLAESRRMWHIAHYLNEQKNQEEDKAGEDKDFQVRNLVRPCNLYRANELRDITALNPPKAKAKPKAKGK